MMTPVDEFKDGTVKPKDAADVATDSDTGWEW
jgi:hypothetical protein